MRTAKLILTLILLTALFLSGVLAPSLRQRVQTCFWGESPAGAVFRPAENRETEVMAYDRSPA